MPIVVTLHEFPLRGYTVYADDLPIIAAALGQPCTYRYWTDHSARSADTTDPERLTRRDVAGFGLVGPDGTFELHRESSIAGAAGTAKVETRDAGTAESVINSLQPRRYALLPWRAYSCRFVARNRADHIARTRWIVGIVLAALAIVVAVVVPILTA